MKELSSNVAEIQVSYMPTKRPSPFISSSNDAYQEVRQWFTEETLGLQEQFIVLYLNRANHVIAAYMLSRGGMTGTIADPRLIFSTALKIAAVGIILAHNHPSGALKPSLADIRLTKKMQEAGKMLEIHLVDHLVLTSDSYYSFADDGKLYCES